MDRLFARSEDNNDQAEIKSDVGRIIDFDIALKELR